MNDRDQSRFVANIEWFNQFFGSIRQLYGIVVEMLLPTGFFPKGFALKSGNFYFPKQNWAPTIPPYYVLMCGGEQLALQIVAVFDPNIFNKQGPFALESSFVVVVHPEAGRYSYINNYALRVIGNREIEIARRADGKFWGSMNSKPPASFFAFQVSFDEFSADQDSRDAARECIVDPITEYLGE